MANLGPEFIVNTTKITDQSYPSITSLADGGFVVTWSSEDSDVCSRARICDADGTPAGNDFIVNSIRYAEEPSQVTALPGGGFVVTWEDIVILARIFDAAGDPIGDEFTVSTFNQSDGANPPVVTTLLDGGFVVTWALYDSGRSDGNGSCIRARRFDAAGNPAGDDFIVNTTTLNDQDDPAIAALPDGGFVVTWHSWNDHCAYARIYGAGGHPVGEDFIVDRTGTVPQVAVTALPDESFVVTWTSAAIVARILDAAGTPVGDSFTVNTTAGLLVDPAIVTLPDGGFFVTWTAENGDGDGSCIRGRIFDASGTAAGDDFIVNSIAAGGQYSSTITVLPDGRLAVSWVSNDEGDGDGSCIRATVLDLDQIGATVNGTATHDVIAGSPFDDRLSGQGGPDVIWAGEGNDTVDGGAGGDTLNGGRGSDVYLVDNAADVVNELPDDGFDTVSSSVSYTLHANVDDLKLLAGAIDGVGNDLDNVVAGNAAANWLSGNDGDDALTSGAGADTLEGGAGADALDGGAGRDAASYEHAAQRVNASLHDAATNSREAAGDSYASVEDIVGSGFNDRLIGDHVSNVLTGSGGADVLIGIAGSDTLEGGAGADSLKGGEGADALDGGTSDDRLAGFEGIDTFKGGLGLDTFVLSAAGRDIVQDFVSVDDTVEVSASRFGGGLVAVLRSIPLNSLAIRRGSPAILTIVSSTIPRRESCFSTAMAALRGATD